MSVISQNLFFSRGDTYTFPCVAQNYQQQIINITGATITCDVKRAPDDSVILFTGTSAITVAASGTFTITFASTDTSTLPDFSQVLIYNIPGTRKGGITITTQSGQNLRHP